MESIIVETINLVAIFCYSSIIMRLAGDAMLIVVVVAKL